MLSLSSEFTNALGALPGTGGFFYGRRLAQSCKAASVEKPNTAYRTQDTMGFLSKGGADNVAGGGGGNYLNPGKLQSGASMRFALCTDEPLEMFECWGENAEGKLKPFRFLEEPTAEDIEDEFGDEWTRRQNRNGDGYEQPKFVIACPAYSYETGSVAVLSLSQKTLIRELDSISQEDDYKKLCEWDFSIGREGTGLATEYTLRPLPPKADRKEIQQVFKKAVEGGFDIKALIRGDNPFPKAA